MTEHGRTPARRQATAEGGSHEGRERQGAPKEEPITHPHREDAAHQEPAEPRELENPPQERGPRERNNEAG